MVVPADIPLTTPVLEPITAVAIILLVHMPPVVVELSVVVDVSIASDRVGAKISISINLSEIMLRR